MSNKIQSQKDYLKKYLSNDSSDHSKKKKKKKKKEKSFGKQAVTIVDDDIDLSKLKNATEEDLEAFNLGEDLPQIAGIIDERPAELIAKEDYVSSSKWKSLANEQNKGLACFSFSGEANIGREESAAYRPRKDIDSQARSERSDEQPTSSRHKDRQSPERRRQRSPDLSPRRNTRRSRERSPVHARRSHKRHSAGSDDLSPERRHTRDRDMSPKRPSGRGSRASPPRRPGRSAERSVERKTGTSPDLSPPRRLQRTQRTKSRSPRRKSNRSPDLSSRKRSKQSPSPDLSPPRRLHRTHRSRSRSPRQKSNRSPDPSSRKRSKQSPSSDLSPQRRPRRHSEPSPSPPRKLKRPFDDSPTDKPKKLSTTLEGKKAGLQNASSMREENEMRRKRDEDLLKKIMAQGKPEDQEARVRSSGRRRHLLEDSKKALEKQKKEDERKEVYDKWGKGLKQIDDLRDRVAAEAHEMSKPLARYADDKDLEAHQRGQVLDGDPMADYFRQKATEDRSNGPSKPVYRGSFPENRFNIRPGYRWDGVDRSNGYEMKWFETQNKKRAVQEEAYKYSVEDM